MCILGLTEQWREIIALEETLKQEQQEQQEQQERIVKLNDEYARIVGRKGDERTVSNMHFMYPSVRVRRTVPTITTTAIGK